VLDLMENRLHQRSDGAWRILIDNLDKQISSVTICKAKVSQAAGVP
jgi:hypothetical protein